MNHYIVRVYDGTERFFLVHAESAEDALTFWKRHAIRFGAMEKYLPNPQIMPVEELSVAQVIPDAVVVPR